MRIGIDMLAAQSPGSRRSGPGLLGRGLVAALLKRQPRHDLVLYAHEGLPDGLVPRGGGARVVPLRPDPRRGERTPGDALDRLARTNPDGLDALLLLDPFETHGRYAPPAPARDGPRLAAYVHDAAAFQLQELYLREACAAGAAYCTLERLRGYDVLLASNEAARGDFLRLLGLPAHRIVTVHGDLAAEGTEIDAGEAGPEGEARLLRDLGIDGPFILNRGGMDEMGDRSNFLGLIEAYRLLPERLRSAHRLVISGDLHEDYMSRLRGFARERGVEDGLVLAGEAGRAALRALHRGCAAFASPSRHEGFGLTLLEAMRCGAAVLAGDNTSQPEMIGDAGLLANADDPADIAAKLARLLDDRPLARELGRRAAAQAARFRWERTADRVVEALEGAPGGEAGPRPRSVGCRPRIAVFSPFPPKGSGVANYAAALVEALRADYRIDLYHEPGYVPEPGLASPDLGCHDHRLFPRRAATHGYRAVLYQMGNSGYHDFLYPRLIDHPGLVTLHDFCLAGFQYAYAGQPGAPADHFRRQVEDFDPARAPEVLARLAEWEAMPGGVPAACARAGLHLNRGVFEAAEAVVCHSPWCRDQVARLFPEHLDRVAIIPLGARAEDVSPASRAATRARFGLPADAVIFGSFGFLLPNKLNVETVAAFAAIAGEFPSARLLFVGHDLDRGAARGAAEGLGLRGRVHFLGRRPAADYRDLAAAIDVGVALRRPPTHGETSASLLDLLRLGIPTVVTDAGTFADFPDSVVRKVRWEAEGIDGLRLALRELASDPRRREALGGSARTYVAEHHAWPRCAGLYADLIERLHARRRGGRPRPGGWHPGGAPVQPPHLAGMGAPLAPSSHLAGPP